MRERCNGLEEVEDANGQEDERPLSSRYLICLAIPLTIITRQKAHDQASRGDQGQDPRQLTGPGA